jgi:hypothetical protein
VQRAHVDPEHASLTHQRRRDPLSFAHALVRASSVIAQDRTSGATHSLTVKFDVAITTTRA